MRKLMFATCAGFAFAGPAQAQSLQDQQACAAAAQKADDETFKAYNVFPSHSVTHESYFNPNLNVCLVLLTVYTTAKDGHSGRTEILRDAIGGHAYGEYEENNPWELPSDEDTDTCWVNFNGQKRACNSEAQFESLITPYFHS